MAKVFRDKRPRRGGWRPWIISYVGLDGKRHRLMTDATSKEEASAILRAKLSENAKAKILGVQTTEGVKPVPFDRFFTDTYLPFIETRVRPSTYKRKLLLAVYVRAFFGSLPLRGINAGHVSDYMARRARAKPRPSNREINMERGLLSTVLNEAFRHGLVDVNECSRVRPLKETAKDRWLKPEEFERILESADPWLKPFCLLGVHTGMREGEIANLQWPHLEHSPGCIRIGHESKTGKVRFIPINSAVEKLLAGQSQAIGPNGRIPWVFLNPHRRKPFRPDSVYHGFRRAVGRTARKLKGNGKTEEAAALGDVTFHTLRHTFASWLIQAGVPLIKVQQYLGHASDHMTRRYAHLAPATAEDRSTLEVLVQDGTSTAQKGPHRKGAL